MNSMEPFIVWIHGKGGFIFNREYIKGVWG